MTFSQIWVKIPQIMFTNHKTPIRKCYGFSEQKTQQTNIAKPNKNKCQHKHTLSVDFAFVGCQIRDPVQIDHRQSYFLSNDIDRYQGKQPSGNTD